MKQYNHARTSSSGVNVKNNIIIRGEDAPGREPPTNDRNRVRRKEEAEEKTGRTSLRRRL